MLFRSLLLIALFSLMKTAGFAGDIDSNYLVVSYRPSGEAMNADFQLLRLNNAGQLALGLGDNRRDAHLTHRQVLQFLDSLAKACLAEGVPSFPDDDDIPSGPRKKGSFELESRGVNFRACWPQGQLPQKIEAQLTGLVDAYFKRPPL